MALKLVTKADLRQERPVRGWKKTPVLAEHVRQVQIAGTNGNPRIVHEFVGTDDFAAAWYERQRYEVDAGRDEEPILYTPLYQIIEDETLPRNVPVYRIGPGGVVFQQ